MTSFTLKLIAMVSMFLDHFSSVFEFFIDTEYLHIIGRAAFPIFAFFIAEGCRHSKNVNRYILRLGVFALISEPFFDVAFFNSPFVPKFGVFEFSHQNVFFTLAAGALAIQAYKKLKHNSGFVIAGIAALCELINTDYGVLGVLCIVLCYTFNKRRNQLIALFGMMMLLYFRLSLMGLLYLSGAGLGVALLAFYNNLRGRNLKWLIYTFYPLHLLILIAAVNIYGYFCK